MSQLHRDKDGGRLDHDGNRHDHGVDDEGGPGPGPGGHHPEHGEHEEEEADGEDEIRHSGEMGVDDLEIGQEVNVYHDAAEIKTRGGRYEQHQVEDTQGNGVVASHADSDYHSVKI